MRTSLLIIACLLLTSVSSPAKAKKKPAPAPAPEATPEPAGLASPGELLSKFLGAHLGEIVAPLGAKGFTGPEKIVELRVSFADEMAQAPQSIKPAYQAAIVVCDALSNAAAERQKTVATLASSAAVHADNKLGAIRKDNAGWLEQDREFREQKQRNKDAGRTDAFLTAGQKTVWVTRAEQLREGIQQSFLKEREIERQGIAAETAESQKRAVALYPELAVPASALNQDFLRRVDALKASRDVVLQNPDWPELIARQSFDAVPKPAPTPIASDKPDADSEPAHNPAAPGSLFDKLANTTWSVDFAGKDPKIAWVTLNTDMTAQSGWRHELGWWKLVDGSRIETRITDKKFNKVLTFSSDLTKAKDKEKHVYLRLEAPPTP